MKLDLTVQRSIAVRATRPGRGRAGGPGSDRREAVVALATAGVLWGLTVPLSKLALGWLDPAWLATARFAVAAPLLALVARRGLRDAATARIAWWGAVGYGALVLLQNLGIARTSVSHAALIVGAVPALVALLAAARGRSAVGRLAWVGFAVALGGVGLVAGGGGNASLAGDVLVLASAVVGAFYIEAQSRLLPGRDPVAVTAVQMGAAAVVVSPVALVLESPPTVGPTAVQLGALVALVTVGSLLPYALYAWGQARVPAEVAGAFINLEPLVGATVGALAFQDPIGGVQALGGAAILAGILLSVDRRRSGRRRRRRGAGRRPALCEG